MILEDNMRRLIGYHIEVHLKAKDDQPYGLLIDIDDGVLYLKESADNKRVCAIPKENINYVIIDDMSFSNVSPDKQIDIPSTVTPIKPPVGIRVMINDEAVAEILTPPTFKLSEWHEDILKIVMSDHSVKLALASKVQTALNYFGPVEDGFATVSISAEDDGQATREGANTFSMSMGAPVASEYLDPAEMISRLNKVSKGVKK